MLNQIRKIALALCLGLISHLITGQNNTSSPYSMFGVGDLYSGFYGRNAALGGVSAPLLSIYNLNPSNPASYVSVLPQTFIFEVGFAANNYTLTNSENSFSKFDLNVRSVAIGFPVAKWWKAGVGLTPHSSVGYSIQESFVMEPDSDFVLKTYRGEGGINNFYVDNAFQIFKSFSVGVKMAYMFGSVDRIRGIDTYNKNLTINTFLLESNRSVVGKFSYSLGAHFHKSLSSDLFLNLGATYNFKTDLTASYEKLTTLSVQRPDNSLPPDTLVDEIAAKGAIQLPQGYSLGASLLIKQKLELAFDYQFDNWSKSRFFGENHNLSDNQRYSFGAEYTPDFGSSKYFKVVKYRAGFNYTKSYLGFEQGQLSQIGGSAGLGLPLRSGAIINVGLLYYQRGLNNQESLKENVFQVNLNFSFKANWFFKRHFD
jgi:hypothetical protein